MSDTIIAAIIGAVVAIGIFVTKLLLNRKQKQDAVQPNQSSPKLEPDKKNFGAIDVKRLPDIPRGPNRLEEGDF
jgi:hypothetical protein